MTSALAKRPTKPNSRSAGMTLMEIMVAIAVVGLIALAMTASIGGIFGARLDASANKLSGMVRYTYSLASLSGKVHRIVVSIADGSYRVEEVQEQKECHLEAEDKEAARKKKDNPLAAIEELTGTSISDNRVKTEKLPDGISFAGLKTRHNGQVVEEGEESIYFFPDGTAERAFVWLTDGDEVFTVEVTSLQGTGLVWSEELDAAKLEKK
jgi:general secretion pathway protein H